LNPLRGQVVRDRARHEEVLQVLVTSGFCSSAGHLESLKGLAFNNYARDRAVDNAGHPIHRHMIPVTGFIRNHVGNDILFQGINFLTLLLTQGQFMY
jgi:hypothetical protein